MLVDLLTLYLIAVGTLLVSAGMTFWEHLTHPERSKTLRILASGYATLAIGCAAVLFRRDLPGAWGSAISNLIILSGYLLILHGVASFRGRQYRLFPAGLLVVMAAIWIVAGARWQDVVWNYASSIPIAMVSAMTALEMLRNPTMMAFPARRFVVAITAVHTLFYTFRALILPWLVAEFGAPLQAAASKITLYEGALYSVILPMTLLKLVREERHSHLMRESHTDYLTRIGNRRWFFEEGKRVIEGRGAQGSIAVLAFDMDHFKAINDRYGHQMGDDVLKAFADIARGVLGPNVILARLGGEEFAALLWGDNADRSQALGATVAKTFADTISDGAHGLGIPATVSIGLAQFENERPELARALSTADRALYRAKSLGGNRLEVAHAMTLTVAA